jgi:hypothetical protein
VQHRAVHGAAADRARKVLRGAGANGVNSLGRVDVAGVVDDDDVGVVVNQCGAANATLRSAATAAA